MILRGIHRDEVSRYEEFVTKGLETIPYDDMSPESVMTFLRSADLQLWILFHRGQPDAFIITEIVHRPARSVLIVKFGAGKMPPQAAEMFRAVVIPWAKMYGCSRVEVWGRPGWARLLNLREKLQVMRGEI